MKKKIFSTLLMVAFTLASTSMFVSCKDYDDDINQKADKSTVAALESTLNQLKADFEAFKAEAQRAHDSFATWVAHNALKDRVDGLEKAIKDLQDEIANLAKAEDVKKMIDNLQEQIDNLKQNNLTQADLDELATKLTALDNKYAALLENYATISYVDAVKLDLQGQIDALKAYEQKIAEITTALEGKLDASVFEAFKAGLGTTYYTQAQIDEMLKKLETDLKAEMGDESALNEKIQKLQELIESVQSNFDNYYLKSEIDSKLEGVITADKLQELYDYVNAELGKKADKSAVDNLEAFLNAFLSVIPDLPEDKADQLKKFQEIADKLVNGYGRDINILNVLLSKRVTSVVFKAEFAGLGRNAVEAAALAYQPHIKVKGTGRNEVYYYLKKKDYTSNEYDGEEMPVLHYPENYKAFRQNPWAVIADFTEIDHSTYAVPSKAYYHINPNSVDLSTATLSFVANQFVWHEEVESRLTDKIIENWAVPTEPQASKNPLSAAGVMTVEFTIEDWENYIKQLGDNYMDTVPFNWIQKNVGHVNTLVNEIALRVTDNAVDDEYKDVVSDYATVVPGMIHIQGLSDNFNDVWDPEANNWKGTYQSSNSARDWKPLPLPVMPTCKQNDDLDGPEKHLFKKAADAIDNGYTHQVVYDGFIDFLNHDDGAGNVFPLIEVHYTYMGAGNYSVENKSGYGFGEMEQTMSEEMFKRLGLSYRWRIVEYAEGDNDTHESAHLEQDPEIPSKFYPRSVTDEGKTISGKTATREALYREPLVNVELLDKYGNVIEAGYIKLQIVEKLITPPDSFLEFTFNFDDDEYVNCDKGLEREVTWSQMENLLLAKLGELGYSKEQFEIEYQIDQPDAVKQYIRTVKDGVATYTESKTPFGTVEYTKKDDKSDMTNILKWTISDGTDIGEIYKKADPKDLYYYNENYKDEYGQDKVRRVYVTRKTKVVDEEEVEYFVDKDGNEVTDKTIVRIFANSKPFTIYVRFEKIVGAGPDLYVALTIPVGMLHFATGQIDNTKTLSQWFLLNTDKNATKSDGSDAREVRVNVPVPASSGETKTVGTFSYINDNLLEETEFVKDLHDYFIKGQIKLALDEPTKFPSFAGKTPQFEFTLPSTVTGNATFNANASGEWTVKGISGNTYTLYLSNDNMQIICKTGNVVIVELDNLGAIHFIEGEIADDILNYKGHKELGERETFTAYIKLTVPDACYPLDLKGSEWFNIRFVRPLTMGIPDEYTVTDAPNNWQPIDLSKGVTVRDWRNYLGDPTNKVGPNPSAQKFDFAYYQIQLLTALDDIVTDAHLATDKRPQNATKYRENIANGVSPLTGVETINWKNIVNLELRYKEGGKPYELEYKNNGSITGEFHIFIPVYMQYVFGQYKKAYQGTYTMLTVKASVDQPTAKQN